ncbi:MAG: cupin domain-containing protein [Acidobacteriia bacterium]|nr:cupin domain-containing protein [Terriglobia bacterium]
MDYFQDYRAHIRFSQEKPSKTTLFRTPGLLLGINCLEPGQSQPTHQHAEQDKFYFVVEGEGEFTVGKETQKAKMGTTVWAPAGVSHGVSNAGPDRLVLLMGMAPAPPIS